MYKLYILLSLACIPADLCAQASFDHDLFDRVLQEFVDGQGLVRYAALAEDRHQFDDYIASLARHSPTSHPEYFPSPAHELAYWINAYNAFVIKGVIDAYPIASVKDAFLFSGFFKRQEFIAGNNKLTLDDIENGIIRPQYRDPRIHFAVNCGALSCPQLSNRAFTATALETMLEQALEQFAVNPNHVKLQGTQLLLSKILDWYSKDFSDWFPADRPNPAAMPPIVNYLLPYLPPETVKKLIQLPQINLVYRKYDWALNEAKK